MARMVEVWSVRMGLGQPTSGPESRGPAGRQAGVGEGPSTQPHTHLQLTVLVHRQVARLQVLGTEAWCWCSATQQGQSQGPSST